MWVIAVLSHGVGIRTALLERKEAPTDHPQAHVVMPRAIEVRCWEPLRAGLHTAANYAWINTTFVL